MVLSGISEELSIIQNDNPGIAYLTPLSNEEHFSIQRMILSNSEEFIPQPIILAWKVHANNIKGVWRPTADLSKRIEADWELLSHESRISIDAPVLSLFGNNDENILTFSCSNAINRIELNAKYREEDSCFYCHIIFFTECKYTLQNFSADIRLDYRKIPFSQALRDTSEWWETQENLRPTSVPEIALKPLYSTWYQFHQNLDEELLLSECKLAKELGFESIIIDDGWQTLDNNRGYDHTGDWQPDRFHDFPGLVESIKEIGLKVGIWYSVPFCGKKSNAYSRFKGKFLTENHRWAPVLDPRYGEVREYLIDTYVNAVKNWNLDGLKLDFIDDFKSYPDTDFSPGGKDVLSINEAVDILLASVITRLKAINPHIFIEFRQKYTGPAMRKYGNMLRAFDCPGDFTMNRVRITDIKLLAGNTAVHADMVKWNFKESVEQAALHYMNALFGVPQISVMLTEAPEQHLQMVRFYTAYWQKNAEILLSQNFYPTAPMENYPVLITFKGLKKIIGLYGSNSIVLSGEEMEVDVLNAKLDELVLIISESVKRFSFKAFTCVGALSNQGEVEMGPKSAQVIRVPHGGLLQLTKHSD